MKNKDLGKVFRDSVYKWTVRKQKAFLDVRSLPKQTTDALHGHVGRMIDAYKENPEVCFFLKEGELAGFIGFGEHLYPRIKNQKSIDFSYDEKYRAEFFKWAKPILQKLIDSAPRGTSIGYAPVEEKLLKPLLTVAHGYHRSEILVGDVTTALNELVRVKNPPTTLNHLDLEIRVIKSVRELDSVMKLQKRVSIQNREHTYFGHSQAQLENDRREYKSILKTKRGLLLGVYSKNRLKGVMITIVLPEAAGSKAAGLSFFLDRSIQGRGVATVGYRLLLDFLKRNGIKTFTGGTSQPAVKALGRVMKRELRYINVVRMTK